MEQIQIDKDTDVFMLFVIGVGISLFMGAIFFPLFYVGGEERNEVFLVISLLCGIGFVMGLTTLINTLFPAPMTTMQIILGGVIIFACALLVFVISCPVKYSLQGTTQGRYLTGGVPPVRFSM